MSQFRSFVASLRSTAHEFAPPADVIIIDLPFSGVNSGNRSIAYERGSFILELNSTQAIP